MSTEKVVNIYTSSASSSFFKYSFVVVPLCWNVGKQIILEANKTASIHFSN